MYKGVFLRLIFLGWPRGLGNQEPEPVASKNQKLGQENDKT